MSERIALHFQLAHKRDSPSRALRKRDDLWRDHSGGDLHGGGLCGGHRNGDLHGWYDGAAHRNSVWRYGQLVALIAIWVLAHIW
jgi:hypothetical protein